jgi:nucleotide-binding universal stress UspA family protein
MKTVLAPIDFSNVSEHVIARAIELARATGARLVLLHVVAPFPIFGKNLELTVTGAELAAAAEKTAANKLVKLQRSLRDDGVTAHIVHVRGDPRECIIEQTERLTADYIVIGSHGHTAFYDLLVGSTTSGVLKRASCPVVIVPHGAIESTESARYVAATVESVRR